MNKLELLRQIRTLTSAGMKDCKDALEEANWDIQKATDILKIKGLNHTASNASRVAAEGRLAISGCETPLHQNETTMVEVNCESEILSTSPEFKAFVELTAKSFSSLNLINFVSLPEEVEKARQDLMAATRENIVVRRWFRVECHPDTGMVAAYMHSNSKIGVLVLLESTEEIINNKYDDLLRFGEDIAMQIAAMNPLAVSRVQICEEDVDRQKAIFEAQLAELNKSETATAKILEGKMNKWYQEVCLLDQESVILPKVSVKDVIEAKGKLLGGTVSVLNFIRAEVGQDLEVEKADLAADVAKLIGQ